MRLGPAFKWFQPQPNANLHAIRRVRFVFDQARAGSKGALGLQETTKALEEMRVDTLFLSREQTRDDPDNAERLIALAFAGHASVEEVSGAAGDLLDDESEGIAARLRFRGP